MPKGGGAEESVPGAGSLGACQSSGHGFLGRYFICSPDMDFVPPLPRNDGCDAASHTSRSKRKREPCFLAARMGGVIQCGFGKVVMGVTNYCYACHNLNPVGIVLYTQVCFERERHYVGVSKFCPKQ